MIDKPLPNLDERGCLPKGIYSPKLEEFKEKFVNTSPRRQELFGKYQQFTQLCIDAKGIEKHYLDGSYVTNKENPGDIDLLIIFNDQVYVSEISYNNYFEIIHNQDEMKKKYEVHLFYSKNPENEPPELKAFWEKKTEKVLSWWKRFYIDREKNIIDDKPKGFIVFDDEQLKKIVG